MAPCGEPVYSPGCWPCFLLNLDRSTRVFFHSGKSQFPSSCSGLMAEVVNSYADVWLCFLSFWKFSKRFQSCHSLMKKHQHLFVSVSWFSLLFFKGLVHAHLTSDIEGMLSSYSLWGHDGTCPRLNWWRHGSSAKSSLNLSTGIVYMH